MRRFVPPAALSAALLVPAGAAPAHTATTAKACQAPATPFIVVIKATGLTCRAAKRELAGVARIPERRFTTPHGFRCRRTQGDDMQGNGSCRRGDKRIGYVYGSES